MRKRAGLLAACRELIEEHPVDSLTAFRHVQLLPCYGTVPTMLERINPLDFRHPLDARILALAELDRVPLIEKLIALDTQARARARLGRRAAVGSMVRTHAEEALAESDRLGRIIYFLRFRNFEASSTPKDQVLCNALAERLTAKAQWTGEYSL
jgi:hypothetical protein